MAEAEAKETRSVGSEGTFERDGVPRSRLHAVLASVATSRWSRLFGYGVLIVACRIVRTLIRA
jgi:hypothetical protein